jgi:uncharacterized membrane protein (DUF2068 family)
MKEKGRPDPFLRVIAIFKFMKAATCVGIGLGLLHFLHKDVEARLMHAVTELKIRPENHVVQWALDKAGQVTTKNLVSFSVISFFYAILFSIEGTGLYLQKKWGEWFVVILTSSLLPFEAYEIWHKVTAIKILLTIGNLLILGYLIHVIRQKTKT